MTDVPGNEARIGATWERLLLLLSLLLVVAYVAAALFASPALDAQNASLLTQARLSEAGGALLEPSHRWSVLPVRMLRLVVGPLHMEPTLGLRLLSLVSAGLFVVAGAALARPGRRGVLLVSLLTLAQPLLFSAVMAGAFVQLWTLGWALVALTASIQMSVRSGSRGWMVLAVLALALVVASSPLWPALVLTWLIWRLMYQDEVTPGDERPGFTPRPVRTAELLYLPLGVGLGIGLALACGLPSTGALFEGLGYWLSDAGGPERAAGRVFAVEQRVGPAALMVGLLSGVALIYWVPIVAEWVLSRRAGEHGSGASRPVVALLAFGVGTAVVLGALTMPSIDLRLVMVTVVALWADRGIARFEGWAFGATQRRAIGAVLTLGVLVCVLSISRSHQAGLNWQEPAFEAFGLSAASPRSAPLPLSLAEELSTTEAVSCASCSVSLRHVLGFVVGDAGAMPAISDEPYGALVIDFGVEDAQPGVPTEVHTRGARRSLVRVYRPLVERGE